MKAELLHIIEAGNVLGEGILWDDRTGTAWWTDIESCKLYSYQLVGGNFTVFDTPERLCSFGFTYDQNWFVVAFETGIAFYNPFTSEVNFIERPFKDKQGIRFNDGRVGPDGRFWVGTMVEKSSDDTKAMSGLYSLDADLKLQRHFNSVNISNAICWSPNAKFMYFADSPTQTIRRYSFDGDKGELSNERVFSQTSGGDYPDGAITDNKGYLWNAQWGGSKVVMYNPEGEEAFAIDMPVSQPTCVAFGGESGHLLFVTTARQGLSEAELDKQPQAGNLFVYKTDALGTDNNIFKGKQP